MPFRHALKRTQRVTPYEQFAFNEVIHVDKIPTAELSSSDNWICDRCPPIWDAASDLFCRPEAPYQPLSVLHLAGPAKSRTYEIEQKEGGVKTMSLRYPGVDEREREGRDADVNRRAAASLATAPLAS